MEPTAQSPRYFSTNRTEERRKLHAMGAKSKHTRKKDQRKRRNGKWDIRKFQPGSLLGNLRSKIEYEQ